MIGRAIAVAALPACLCAAASGAGPALSGADAFNYVVGTQIFGPAYQFTDQPRLVEAAEVMRALGATVIKFQLSKGYADARGNAAAQHPGVHNLGDLAREEPAHRRVLDMPFAHYVLWAHSFAQPPECWRDGLSTNEAANEYREIHDLAVHLLKTYSGSGKAFYLGHWEGDGWLRGDVSRARDERVTPQAVQGMIDWLNTRQRAVDDAMRETAHEQVQVWNYAEVNHVKLAMREGRPAMVNRVLPGAAVDFVSYSSYDTAADPAELREALDYIASQLPPKPGIAGRRVFIGEYGFPRDRYTPAEQDRLSRQVMRVGLAWGCPFVLYWELYNNELDRAGRQRGFWMIDDQRVKQPVYETHRRYYEWARRRAAASGGTAPDDEFRRAASAFLEEMP